MRAGGAVMILFGLYQVIYRMPAYVGKIKEAFHIEEVKYYIGIIIASTILITANISRMPHSLQLRVISDCIWANIFIVSLFQIILQFNIFIGVTVRENVDI